MKKNESVTMTIILCTQVTHEGTLTVSDVNDNAPTFQNLPHTVRVPENAEFGRIVYEVSATDPDSLAGGIITYSIVNVSIVKILDFNLTMT